MTRHTLYTLFIYIIAACASMPVSAQSQSVETISDMKAKRTAIRRSGEYYYAEERYTDASLRDSIYNTVTEGLYQSINKTLESIDINNAIVTKEQLAPITRCVEVDNEGRLILMLYVKKSTLAGEEDTEAVDTVAEQPVPETDIVILETLDTHADTPADTPAAADDTHVATPVYAPTAADFTPLPSEIIEVMKEITYAKHFYDFLKELKSDNKIQEFGHVTRENIAELKEGKSYLAIFDGELHLKALVPPAKDSNAHTNLLDGQPFTKEQYEGTKVVMLYFR